MEFRKMLNIGKKDNLWYNVHLIRKRHILTTCILTAIVFVLAFLLSYFMKYGEIGTCLVVATLTAILAFVLWNVYILWFRLARRINKMYKKKELYAFRQELLLNKEGITASTEQGTRESKWKYVVNASESRHGFYLKMSDAFAYTIPKKQLTAAEQNTVRAILKKYLSKDCLSIR